ncbi:MAG: tripartite tricarboxylate transporter substrate-binding protein [Vicinamibacterales bacterium]
MPAGRRRSSCASWRLALALVVGMSATPSAAEPQYELLRIIAPAAPGGGWDQTGRAMQQVLQRTGIVRIAPVENVSGAAGTIGLARFISAERGNPDAVMLSGLIMLAAIITHQSPVTLRETTPIARLIGEYEVIVVPAASPFRSLQDLVAAFKKRPESISWGGGSAGGTDQILAGLVADAVGVDATRVNYIAFSGGGAMLSSLLGGQLSLGVNGLAEMQPQIAAGALRVLGISSPERLPGVDAPTLREQGVDVDLVNWRSLVAPPGISAVARRRMVAAMDAMVRTPEWRALLERYHWQDSFLTGRDFDEFVAAEEERVHGILAKLGTGHRTTATRAAATGYPILILAGLAVTGVATFGELVRRWRRSNAGAPSGRRRPVALIATGMILDLMLLEVAGFVLASAVLFWFVARAFDHRRPLRDAAFAAGISVAAYLLFVRVLKLSLPAGVLAGWL